MFYINAVPNGTGILQNCRRLLKSAVYYKVLVYVLEFAVLQYSSSNPLVRWILREEKRLKSCAHHVVLPTTQAQQSFIMFSVQFFFPHLIIMVA
ncbi:hypothetical protein OWV82_019443 [Melia azedarach]|uniref:Uncharacterized protein n=1 Tax=Melia azedarach TaxID=155640 RepID=A0ACC1XE84_MELAZ|nr:hypothetical protein OWV82_019443 [Melia azedarach]